MDGYELGSDLNKLTEFSDRIDAVVQNRIRH